MIAYLFFFQLWYIGRSYWVRDDCSAIIFVKHVKTVFIQALSYSTQSSADALFVVKAPANAIMQHKQRTKQTVLLYLFPILRNLESNLGFLLRKSLKLLTQNLEKSNFDMFYENYR